MVHSLDTNGIALPFKMFCLALERPQSNIRDDVCGFTRHYSIRYQQYPFFAVEKGKES